MAARSSTSPALPPTRGGATSPLAFEPLVVSESLTVRSVCADSATGPPSAPGPGVCPACVETRPVAIDPPLLVTLIGPPWPADRLFGALPP